MAHRALLLSNGAPGIRTRSRAESLPSYINDNSGRQRRPSLALHNLSENLPEEYDPEFDVDRLRHERPDHAIPMNLIDDGGHRAENMKIGASVLGIDSARLVGECMKLSNIGADFLRFDIMDGNFIPGDITFGPTELAAVRRSLVESAIIDAHLFVARPAAFIESLKAAGASRVIVHYESANAQELTNILAHIHSLDMRAGLAILPKTSAGLLLTFADLIDTAVVMTADPMQPAKFQPLMLEKVKRIRKECPELEIEVSGAVGPSNIQGCAAAGANSFVASEKSTVSPDPAETWKHMHVNIIRDMKERRPSYHLTDYYQLEECFCSC